METTQVTTATRVRLSREVFSLRLVFMAAEKLVLLVVDG